MAKRTKVGKQQSLVEVLGRAIIDETFRDRLIDVPETVAAEYKLSKKEIAALKNINKTHLEEAASRLTGHADFTISISITGHFDAKV